MDFNRYDEQSVFFELKQTQINDLVDVSAWWASQCGSGTNKKPHLNAKLLTEADGVLETQNNQRTFAVISRVRIWDQRNARNALADK